MITAGLGFLINKTLNLDPKTISRVTFYLFSPALVFQILSTSTLDSASVYLIVGFAFASNLTVGLLAFLISRVFKFSRKVTIAVILTTFITNAGNFGLSVNKFAFGDAALAYASIYFVCSSIMVYTIGVAIASMGQFSFKDSLINLLKLPTLYALIFAIIFNIYDIVLPISLDRSVGLLAGAAIPAMLLLLGMQLGQANLRDNRLPLTLATGVRLVVGPIIAVVFSIPFGLQGPALQAGIMESSMPTAVMTTILATEFDVVPSLVSTIVTATTILSPFTLTPLIAFLGSG
jgi:predicted permease